MGWVRILQNLVKRDLSVGSCKETLPRQGEWGQKLVRPAGEDDPLTWVGSVVTCLLLSTTLRSWGRKSYDSNMEMYWDLLCEFCDDDEHDEILSVSIKASS